LLSYKIKDTRLIIFVRYFLYASLAGIALIGKIETEMFGEYNVESVAINPLSPDYLFRISNETDGSG
jgi:hypothetical protein